MDVGPLPQDISDLEEEIEERRRKLLKMPWFLMSFCLKILYFKRFLFYIFISQRGYSTTGITKYAADFRSLVPPQLCQELGDRRYESYFKYFGL